MNIGFYLEACLQGKAYRHDIRAKPQPEQKWFLRFLLKICEICEPTNEARAETKLVWALPCKEEEVEVKSA